MGLVRIHRLPANKPNLDWSYLYFLARTKLGFTEEEFWESSIEKINDLIDVYGADNNEELMKRRKKDLKNNNNNNKEIQEVYIDEVSFF